MSQHSGSPRKVALLPRSAIVFMRRRAVESAGLALFALATALALALASYDPDDAALNVATAAAPNNWLGVPGAMVADLLLQGMGLASIAVVGVMASWAWRIASHRGLPWYGLRLALAPLCLLLLAGIAALVTAPAQWPQVAGLGGYAGDWLLQASARPLALLGITPQSPIFIVGLVLSGSLLLLYLLGIRFAEWLGLAKAGLAGLARTLGAARLAAAAARRFGRQAAGHAVFRREPRLTADQTAPDAGALTIKVGAPITPGTGQAGKEKDQEKPPRPQRGTAGPGIGGGRGLPVAGPAPVVPARSWPWRARGPGDQ